MFSRQPTFWYFFAYSLILLRIKSHCLSFWKTLMTNSIWYRSCQLHVITEAGLSRCGARFDPGIFTVIWILVQIFTGTFRCDFIGFGRSLVALNRIPTISVTEQFLDNCLGQNKLFWSLHESPLIVRTIKGALVLILALWKALRDIMSENALLLVVASISRWKRRETIYSTFHNWSWFWGFFPIQVTGTNPVVPLIEDDITDFYAVTNKGVTMADSSDDVSPQLESCSTVRWGIRRRYDAW